MLRNHVYMICTSKHSTTNHFIFFNTTEHNNIETFNKLFCLTTMIYKYLIEQLGVFLNIKQK